MLKFLGILLLGLGLCGAAQAKTYVGTYSGNDPFSGHGQGYLFGSPSLAKCDVKSNLTCKWTDGIAAGDYRDAFDVTFTNDKSGSWSWSPSGDETLLPRYLVIKGGPNYVVYELAPGELSGSWNTNDLWVGNGNHPSASHISWYDGYGSVVPAPATWGLMIAAFGGLGWRLRARRAAHA